MEKLPYNPPEEDFQKANLSEKYLYDLYHDSHPTYTPLQYAKKVIVADRLVRNTPIPVEEKPWERKGFCDTEGCCWVWRTDGISEFWEYINPNSKIFDINESDCAGKYTHCLPHDFIQQPNKRILNLQYFRANGEFYSNGNIEVPESWSVSRIVEFLRDLREKESLPNLYQGNFHKRYFTVYVNSEGHPSLPVIIPSVP